MQEQMVSTMSFTSSSRGVTVHTLLLCEDIILDILKNQFPIVLSRIQSRLIRFASAKGGGLIE